jgi:Holliday junction DNA helicase RuvA
MIATVRGAVATVTLDSAVIEVGGVGILVHAAPGTLAELVVGHQAQLSTSLVVREDSLTLFGFLTDDERATFELVQTVSGIGPRLALAMLAVHEPDGLRRAVASDDLVALTRVPGIGRKGAQRLVLELKDRLGPPGRTAEQTPVLSKAAADGRPQVRDALVGLGWSVKAADDALDQVLADSDDSGAASADIAGLLRAALRRLGRP